MATYKKVLIVISLLALVAVPVFYRPKQTQAFTVIPVVIVNKAKWVWEKISSVVNSWKKTIITRLAVNTTRMFLNTMAYNVADAIAKNGAGGKPLFDNLPIGKSLEKAGLASAGEFLGTLTQETNLSKLGLNLCNPSIDVKLSITLSLLDDVDPPQPSCNITSVLNQWQGLKSRFAQDSYNQTIRSMLQVNTYNESQSFATLSDFFTSISTQSSAQQYQKIYDKLQDEKTSAEEAKELQIQICKGYLNKELPITGEVRTPCSSLLNMTETQWDAAIAGDSARYFQLADSFDLKGILAEAGNTFLSTLSSKLLKIYFDKGMFAFNKLFEKDQGIRSSLADYLRGGTLSNRSGQAAEVYRNLVVTDFKEVENYNFLSDFSICPAESDFQGLDNCVIDQKFLAAIVSNKTISEAIDEGLLDPNTVLIGRDDPRNNENDCYQYGWCYRDLVKMRKANILPVGVELAALRSSPGSAVTIKEAIDCFEDHGDCEYGIDPQYDFNHNPYYHLVDPDWTLEVPATRCNAVVNGPALQSYDSSTRQSYCADPQVCLRMDDDGNCIEGQYGYCTRTENIWRFDGNICEDGDLYSGCLSFEHEELGNDSYLEWTLDYCSADEAGCRRYAQRDDGNGNWLLEEDMTLPPAIAPLNQDDLFLSSDDCEASAGGCDEYILLAANNRANILANGDFEINDDAVVNTPDGFYQGVLVVGEGVNGSNAIRGTINAAAPNQPACVRMDMMPNTNYTVSAYAKRGPGNGDARIMIDNCHTDAGTEDGGISSPDSSMAVNNDNAALHALGVYDEANVFLPWTDLDPLEYNQFGGTFNSGDSIQCTVCVGASFASSDDHFIDNVKVEITAAPNFAYSTFSAYGAGGKIYMNGKRFMCSAEEVGCQGYNPDDGGPMVPAVITQDDLCPAECVGYATFAEEPNIFDQIEGDDTVDYYYLIPDTANSCTANDVGCEEFTNLDEVAQGGEGKEYYSYLRQCVDSSLATVYYTWEGYDVSGYALKTWQVLQNDQDAGGGHYAPCTNVRHGTNECIDNQIVDGIFYAAAACGPETPADPMDDPDVNPNCREFFDLDGTSFWRLQDRVIFASNDCHDYRRTLTGSMYRAIPDESQSCQAQVAGCRTYKGNAGNNLRTLFNDQFEGTYYPWDSNIGTLSVSEESVINGGHSMKLDLVSGVATDVSRDVADQLREDREYELSWWMKANANVNVLQIRFKDAVITNLVTTLNNIEGGSWESYRINVPASAISGLNLSEARMEFVITGADQVYFDNVSLKEVNENLYLVKDSWNTPLSCDNPYLGYHLGCQAYTDLNGNHYNLRSFDSLCRQEAIGCTTVIDTHNSNYPFEETFNVGDPSELTVSADNTDYLVPDANKFCASSLKGCQMLGLPDTDRLTGEISDYDTVYKINNPDTYDTTLCASEALYCEEYISDKGTYYFKDPGNITCSYKRNALVTILTTGERVPITGWFTDDSLAAEEPIGCSDNGDYVVTPEDFQLPYDGISPRQPVDSGEYWAARCPSDKNLCTTYRDPTDPYNADGAATCRIEETDLSIKYGRCVGAPQYNDSGIQCALAIASGTADAWLIGGACQPYYYYADDNIDETSCYGRVDRNSGCVLLYEENNWNAAHDEVTTLYHTTSTYANNTAIDEPVNPETCDTGDPGCTSNMLIKVRKDRQCSEWLACKASSSVYNEATGEYDLICDELDSCIKYDSRGSVSKCEEWGTHTPVAPLTHRVYQNRTSGENDHLEWSDMDYTGFSAPNLLPAGELSVYNFGTNDNPDFKLMYESESAICETSTFNDDGTPSTDGQACSGYPTDGWGPEYGYYQWINTGLCKDQICWLTPDYSRQSYVVPASTRGYAVDDAPFPISVKTTGEDRKPGYGNANLCYEDGDRCEFGYKKVTYGYGENIIYYPMDYPYHPGACSEIWDETGALGDDDQYCYTDPDTDSTVCIANPYIGSPCQSDANCGTSNIGGQPPEGKCDSVVKVETYINWPGICYEQDWYTPLQSDTNQYAHYCNNWYPIQDVGLATQGIYNNYDTAGYYDPYGNYIQLCAVSNDYTTESQRIYCGATINDPAYGGIRCTELLVVPAGAKINAAELDNESSRSLLTTRFLDGAAYTSYGAGDSITDGGFTYAGVGLPIVVRDDAVRCLNDQNNPCVNGDAMFRPTDFIGVAINNPVTTAATLGALFDVDIERYYLDEGVNTAGAGMTGGEYIEMPASSTSTLSGLCWDPAVPNNQHRHQVNSDAAERLCNPLSVNYYVYGGISAGGAAYPVSTPGTPCNNRTLLGENTGCYQSCRRLLELDPTGDDPDVAVRTDVWWASKPENYDYTATDWGFWYGNTASSTLPASPISSSQYSLNDDLANPDWQAELHYSYILTPSATISGVPDLVTTTIGYAFGASYSATTLEDATNQVQIRLPLRDVAFNVPYETVPFFACNGEACRCWNDGGTWSCWGSNIIPATGPGSETYWDADIQDRIAHLFKRAYSLYWDGTRYFRNAAEVVTFVNDFPRPEVGNSYSEPRALAVCGNNTCTDASGNVVQGISINNQSDGTVVGSAGNMFATARFFYYAHPDHMPIRQVSINWGDSPTFTGPIGKYQNNLPVCNPALEMPGAPGSLQGFGGTDGACHQGYKVFYKNYLYSPVSLCNGGLINIDGTNYNVPNISGASCYKPYVRITDNWGETSYTPFAGWVVVYEN